MKSQKVPLYTVITNFLLGHESKQQQIEDSQKEGIFCIKKEDINETIGILKKCKYRIKKETIPKNQQSIAKKGDILISLSPGKYNVATYLGEEEILVGKNVCLLKHQDNSKYLTFAISSALSKNKENLNIRKIKNLQIVFPEEQIRNEIAEKIGYFMELDFLLNESKLERKEIFEYVKNKMIDELDCEKILLSEVIQSISGGKGVTRSHIKESKNKGVICVRSEGITSLTSGEIVQNFYEKVEISLIKNPIFAEKGDILFGRTEIKKIIGKPIAYLGEEKVVVGQGVQIIKHKENPKYLAFVLNTKNCEKQRLERSTLSSSAYINHKDLEKIKIPLPSLEKQNEIVEKLEKLYKV